MSSKLLLKSCENSIRSGFQNQSEWNFHKIFWDFLMIQSGVSGHNFVYATTVEHQMQSFDVFLLLSLDILNKWLSCLLCEIVDFLWLPQYQWSNPEEPG